MSKPWRHPRSGVWYFRRSVPEKLRAALRWEVKRSLETRDPEEAKSRWFAEASLAINPALGFALGLPLAVAVERGWIKL